MKSVLLGGLKVFLTNDSGFPLSAPGGRAKFFKAGTSTPETVYSNMALTTAIGPVVNTDSLGALPAIWLKTDRLYKVVVEQKVSDDPEVWTVLWEVDNVGEYVPESAGIAGDPSAVVSSISELKAVDHGEHATVQVLGYYSAGDWGEPSTFVYDAESTASADDGAFVEPNDHEGRWVQIFEGGVLDVRKFGAIPDLQNVSDVTAQVMNAANYSQINSTRSRPIKVGFVAPGKYSFSAGFNFPLFSFTDISDSSTHRVPWFINKDVVLVGTDVFRLSKDTECLTVEKLIGGTASLLVEGGGEIKVDPAWWGNSACNIENCYVECHSATSNNKVFTNCDIVSNGFIDGYVRLIDSGFKESWFVDGYDFSKLLVSDAFMGSIYDCDSADSYIDIKNFGGENDYGDLGGMTITGKELLSGCLVENAVFDNVVLSGNATLRNVRGTVSVKIASAIKLVDCEITINGYNGANTLTLTSLDCAESSVSSSLTKIVVNGPAAFSDSLVNVNLEMNGTPVFLNCEINGNVTSKAVADGQGAYHIYGQMRNCNLHGRHYLYGVSMGNMKTLVHFRWTDNWSDNATPVDVSNLAPYVDNSVSHDYVYKGNTGTFMKDRVQFAMAYSYTVTNMNKGWRVNPLFSSVNVFLVGKKSLKITVHVDVGSTGFGALGGAVSKYVEVTSGSIYGSTIAYSVQMPDIETEVGTKMREVAEGGGAKVWASVEIL